MIEILTEVLGALFVGMIGFWGRNVYDKIMVDMFKQVPNDLLEEINSNLKTIFNDPKFSIKDVSEKVTYLHTAEEFFTYKKRMVDSLGKADDYILFVGRPFFHLLQEERDELASQLSASAKAYLNSLNSHLTGEIGYFTYFIDPFDTIKQILSKIRYSIEDIKEANKLLLQEIKNKSPRLKMYASPPQTFDKDIILVNTENMKYEIVFGHRPLGRTTFEKGVRIKSQILYNQLYKFVQNLKVNIEDETMKEKDLQYFLDDALQRYV